ncbi:CYTH domain-containing protein [Poritiphilus flavus]|uniref:CYTH domain-containing protein n=1 Tax=Poritiphilus flavus TaxID=2697053 RepID=A0A6L9EDP6_9FLAO|nr:CYTH domain-containing protein [Poritiphilus flavus]NAS12479.1 CYTH domain-containing protein [Poritiphilus flavus]
MIEIERKFLVTSDVYKQHAISKNKIYQGFLNSHPLRTVRVRLKGESGTITVKGLSDKEGTTRFEWEKEITGADAKALLQLCEDGMISKTRYEVPAGRHIFEVDEFHGANEGLVIAEVELGSKNEAYSKPDWLGKEVTGDPRYYNSQLSKQPFTKWKS